MDDGFFLVELTEDEDGNEKSVQLGFLRIAKTGKNNEDPLALSSAKQLYGKRGDVGSLVMEHPRLGMDVRGRAGFKSLNNLAIFTGENGVWKDEKLSAMMFGADISYNVAPIIGVSQTFLDVGLGFGMITSASLMVAFWIIAFGVQLTGNFEN